MKVASLVFACALIVLAALMLVPSAAGYHTTLALAVLAGAACVLVTIAVGWRATATPGATANAIPPVAPALTPAASAISPAVSAVTPAQARAEVVSFLATLQDKGRLVDFLEDDIARYSDAQVGAAARVVHAGCRAVLREHFRIVPVRPENEGSSVTVAPGYAADEYRLVGKIGGHAPFSGTLMHRGWKTDAVTLPRVLLPGDDRLPTIAPAEVELR